ncbi:hypothetical protein HL658_27515 [Azospirillum sp. RWY-5-1]|uniref:Uncharacterized protein n=1 Tax=Azospirillum oleiclasticum TaxID=2735135 RepID=A0ABX2TL24_9PROT|nr:hypothetical protein [Azospirillum oleiclasticum]NYZ16307.1 hypothetical protein [Azospirillum oleiclasticum]NYZ23794.1 hypothetical protein [Azospirillum oleiclasticum]
MRLSAIVAFVALLSVPAIAMAQQGGVAVDLENRTGAAALNGPVVNGRVDAQARVGGGVTARASGENSRASNSISSVTGGSVTGDVQLRSEVNGDVTAEATGRGSCAENHIASIGPKICGN